MKHRRYKKSSFFALLVALVLLASTPNSTSQAQEHGDPNSYQSYAGLAELVNLICDDAMQNFHGFFGPSVVEVMPFQTLGAYQKKRISSLGLTLADQVVSVINKDTTISAPLNSNAPLPGYQQSIGGLLQEVDGYLRVHISAVNVYGQRMSYTTNVEMSEPIYRALHTSF